MLDPEVLPSFEPRRQRHPGRLPRCCPRMPELEYTDHLGQLADLVEHRLRCRRALLDQRRVLLGAAVHLRDGLLTCSMPLRCSSDAELISPMMSVTRRTLLTTSCMVAPARSTSAEPAPTCPTESSIRALISLAAAAERWARLRTSEATTAKPRPCSPARAASTAAFSARMLVWKEMPSITPMMSTIFLDDALIELIVSTTCATTAPACSATADAEIASWLACLALPAFCLTVEVSSSIVDAVSSIAPACCSVREDRSRLPAAISPAAVAIASVPPRTSVTMVCRLAFMSYSACSSWPVSSRAQPSMEPLKSPAATRRATPTARCSG